LNTRNSRAEGNFNQQPEIKKLLETKKAVANDEISPFAAALIFWENILSRNFEHGFQIRYHFFLLKTVTEN